MDLKHVERIDEARAERRGAVIEMNPGIVQSENEAGALGGCLGPAVYGRI